MGLVTILALLALAGGLGYIRFVPSLPAVWHVDPVTVARPGLPNFWLLRDGDGNAPALILDAPPDQVMARLDSIARATPRTRLLAGEGFHKTWITRTRLMGYPDYTSVRVEPEGEGTRLSLFARSRFGGSDFGVNRARAEAWLAALN